jgi:hypothetical protein
VLNAYWNAGPQIRIPNYGMRRLWRRVPPPLDKNQRPA